MADTQQNILINIDVETGQVNSQLDQIDQKIGSLGKNTNLESFKSIKSEILAAREEAVKLAIAIEDAEASGENVDRLSERYSQVTQRAAQLNDAVGKVNDSIANANPDNRLQGLISVAQGAATAVQGVAGAFALVGVDAEDAQVVIAKLQGLIALTDSISSIDKIIDGYKDLKSNINLASIAQRASNAATAAAAVVQRVFTGSVVATGTAFKALKVAIASTGIGLLVIAITAAIVAIASWISSSKKAEEQAIKQKEALDKLNESYEDEVRKIKQSNAEKLLQLKLQGASEKKLREQAYNAQIDLVRAANKRLRDLEEAGEKDKERLRQAGIDIENEQGRLRIILLENNLKDREELENTSQKNITASTAVEVDNRTNKQKQAITEINQFTEEQREIEKRLRQTDLQNQIDEINKRFERALKLAKAYGKSTVELEKLRNLDIQKATKEEVLKAEEFGITQTLELVKEKVERLGQEISQEVRTAAGSTRDSDAARKAIFDIIIRRNEDIISLFQLGAQTRKRQAELEKETRLNALKTLTFSTDKAINDRRREEVAQIIKEDFDLQIKQIQDEIENAEKSIRKGIDITLLQVNVAEAELNVKQVTEILEKLAVPFRRISEAQATLASYTNTLPAQIRRAFTSIDIEKEIEVFDEFNRKINTQKRINSVLIEIFEKETGIKRLEIESEFQQKSIENQDKQSALILEKIKNSSIDITADQVKLGNELIELSKERSKKLTELELQSTIARQKIQSEQDSLIYDEERKRTSEILKLRQPLFSFQSGEDSFTRNFLSGKSFKKQFDSLISTTGEYYSSLKEQEDAVFQKQLADAKFNNESTEQLEREHFQRLKNIELDYQSDIETINAATLQGKLDLYNQIGAGLGQLGQLFDENKKVQVGFAIAEIAINTATGYMNGLAIAQNTAKAAGPGAAFAFPVFYASQIAAVLASANRAKNLIASIKGGESASSSSSGATAPTPTAINASLFNLPPEAQNVRVVNQASQVVRAYITNEDLRSAQDKQAFLNKLSSF